MIRLDRLTCKRNMCVYVLRELAKLIQLPRIAGGKCGWIHDQENAWNKGLRFSFRVQFSYTRYRHFTHFTSKSIVNERSKLWQLSWRIYLYKMVSGTESLKWSFRHMMPTRAVRWTRHVRLRRSVGNWQRFRACVYCAGENFTSCETDPYAYTHARPAKNNRKEA